MNPEWENINVNTNDLLRPRGFGEGHIGGGFGGGTTS